MSEPGFGEYPDDVTEPISSELPEGEVPAKASRRRKLIFLFAFTGVFAALAFLVSYASHWKQEVIVRGFVVDGESIIPEGELLSRLEKYKGSNLQSLDPDELMQKIMVLPYLEKASISKELNGVVRVKITERTPVARALFGRHTMVLDNEGFLLPLTQEVADRFPDLLTISGVSHLKASDHGLQKLDQRDVILVKEFLEALSASEYARLLIREFHLSPNNLSWCIAVQAPTRFIVGNDGDFKEKLKKFEIFWQKVISKKGVGFYDTVDIRFKNRVFTTVTEVEKTQPDVSR